jgi:hypothetical protein
VYRNGILALYRFRLYDAVSLPHLTVQSAAGAGRSRKCAGASSKGRADGKDLEIVACMAVRLSHSYRIVVLVDINDSEISNQDKERYFLCQF